MFTDSFVYGGTPPNAEFLEDRTGWTRVGGSAGALRVENGASALRNLPTGETAYWCTDQGSADHYTEVVIKASDGFICIRLTDANNFIGFRHSSGSFQVFKRVAGTFTQLGSNYAASISGSQVCRLSASGDTITFTIDGVERCGSPFTESFNNTETRQGLVSRGAAANPWVDDFEADAVGGGDTTAPVLSSPTGTATGSTTATVGATTDEGNGTMYAFVSTSATPPSAADLKAGTGATWSGSQAISTTGAKTLNATGLTASTGYYAHLIHTDAAANDSNIVTSAQFTTSAAAAYSLPADVGSYNLTGQEAYYALGRIALSGSYSLTGNDATLTHSVPGSYSLTANAGSYSLTGEEALFVYAQPNSYSLAADGGTYSTVGRRANLLGPGDSPSLGDGDMFVKLALLGYTGALNTMLLKYYQDNGATSNQLNQAEMEWLAAQGFSTGTINERRAAFFLSFGYAGALNDQESQYWWNL